MKKTEDNDKLRLFGLLFHENNSNKLHRLSVGITSRNQLDDPSLQLKGLFQLIALDFNNGNLKISLPPKASDLDEWEIDELDANDSSRIRIEHCGKWCEKIFKTVLTEYKIILRDWFKGTGGGSGVTSMFENWSSEKQNKYDVNLAIYDHSDIKARPSILIDNYPKNNNI